VVDAENGGLFWSGDLELTIPTSDGPFPTSNRLGLDFDHKRANGQDPLCAYDLLVKAPRAATDSIRRSRRSCQEPMARALQFWRRTTQRIR